MSDNLGLESLEKLDMSYNNISYLDGNKFEHSPHLKQLVLNNNKILSVLKIDKIGSLRHLDLRQNRLTIFPNVPAQLTRLDLSQNEISEAKFPRTSHLTHLDLSYNPLEKIRFDTVKGRATTLVSLKLVSTQLTSVPSWTSTAFPNLQYLDLSQTLISSLMPGDLQSMVDLKNLTMTYCKQLTSIQQSSLPTSVINLNISSNPQLSDIHPEALVSLKNLQFFDISSNNLFSLSVPQNVQLLRLENNPWKCDCRLTQLQNKLRNQSFDAECYSPDELSGQYISKVTLHSCDTETEQLSSKKAKPKDEDNTFIFSLVSVAVLSILILIILSLSKRMFTNNR